MAQEKLGTLGQRILHCRTARNLTQVALAHLCGVDSNTISRWERDNGSPGSRNMEFLASGLGVPIEWLETGIGPVPEIKLSIDRIRHSVGLEKSKNIELSQRVEFLAKQSEELAKTVSMLRQAVFNKDDLRDLVQTFLQDKFASMPESVQKYASLWLSVINLDSTHSKALDPIFKDIISTPQFERALKGLERLK